MPNKIIHKKTGTTGLAPAPGELDHAELAVNYADGDLYLKNLAGDAVVKVTAASNIKNTPAGNIAATNVQSALNELDSEITNLQELQLAQASAIIGTQTEIVENHAFASEDAANVYDGNVSVATKLLALVSEVQTLKQQVDQLLNLIPVE